MTKQKELSISAEVSEKFGFFEDVKENEIVVPDMAISVRNNCQSGRWQIGEKEVGDKVKLLVVHFAKYFGDLGKTEDEHWGQLWFVAQEGDIPPNILYVTYLKSRSLSSFVETVAEIKGKRDRPGTKLFVPAFVKHSGQKPDDKGVLSAINYYSLSFGYEEPKDDHGINSVIRMLENPENHPRLSDPVSTENMICLEGLNPVQQNQAKQAWKMQKYGYIEADSTSLRLAGVETQNALPASADS